MPPKCPNGQRRNRVTGLCEACPPGTTRQGTKCVPIPIGPVPGGPVPPIPIQWPPRPKRCPPSYTRNKYPPYNCEKCPPHTKKNNLSRLCHPLGWAPPPQVQPDSLGVPIITHNIAPGIRCPPNTRRNRRTGRCEGCPRGTRRRRNKCYPLPVAPAPVFPVPAPAPPIPIPAPAPPVPAHVPAPAPPIPIPVFPAPPVFPPVPANAPPTHDQLVALGIRDEVATAMLQPDGFITKTTVQVNGMLNNDSERRLITYVRRFGNNTQNELKDNIDNLYDEIENFRFDAVSFQVYVCFVRHLFGHFARLQTDISRKLTMFYTLLIKNLLEKALPYNSLSIDYMLEFKIPALNRFFFVNKVRSRPDLLEVFEDYGAYYDETSGRLFLKPVTFIPYKPFANQHIPRIPLPNTMFDLVEGDMPMNAHTTNDPDNMYIIVKDDENVTGYSIPLERLKMYISPRQPFALFMKCKGPANGFFMGDDQVFNEDLYVELSKVGVPLRMYVNIDQIKSAIDAGSNFIYIKPTIVGGAKLITQVASASLYKVMGINVVSRSHCEVGHVGGFYDVYLPEPI